MSKKHYTQLGIAAVLVLAAIAWRFVNAEYGVAYNLEIVTAVSLVAAVFLHRYFALLVPLAIVFASDMVIGNTGIAIFTWSAFAVNGVAGLALRRWKGQDAKLIIGTAGMGLGSAVWFFLWTNGGVWLLSDGAFYTKDLSGLLLAYTYGLPFFRTTLMSGVILAPAIMAAAIYAPRLVTVTSSRLALKS